MATKIAKVSGVGDELARTKEHAKELEGIMETLRMREETLSDRLLETKKREERLLVELGGERQKVGDLREGVALLRQRLDFAEGYIAATKGEPYPKDEFMTASDAALYHSQGRFR